MNELNDLITEATEDYFYYLALNGYKSVKDTHKLLVLQFLGELIQGDLSVYITRDDYREIGNALYCLYGSTCLIPYPQYEVKRDILDFIHKKDKSRITEFYELRTSGGGLYRLGKQ